MATIESAYSFDNGEIPIGPYCASGGGGANVSVTYAHTGAYGLSVRGNTGYARMSMVGSPTDPSVSMWVDLGASFNLVSAWALRFTLTSGEYVSLIWNAVTHTFDAYVDGGLVAAGSITVSVNDWFHVQFYCEIDNAGSINAKINGHESISYSGDTLPAGATANVDYFRIYASGEINWTRFADDIVLGHGGYLGNLECHDRLPNADTAQDDYAPSAGADNYAMVDEIPANDADYNETNTNGHADELALEDFDSSDKTPIAVVACVRARMEAATGDSIKVGVDSNGTEEETEHTLSTTWEYYFHTAADNPDGDIPWDDAAIDALLLRYEAVIS